VTAATSRRRPSCARSRSPHSGVSTTDFELSSERADALLRSGREAAQRFLETWDFDAYVETYRAGKRHSRREAVAEKMS
jgi:NTE family protein